MSVVCVRACFFLHCVHMRAHGCICVHMGAYMYTCTWINIPACASIHVCITGVDRRCRLMSTWNSHCIVFTPACILRESRYNTICILYFLFTWNSYCILYLLPPCIKGGAGIRGIITPVYINLIFISMCKIEIPLFCTVYSKERTPNVHLYRHLHSFT